MDAAIAPQFVTLTRTSGRGEKPTEQEQLPKGLEFSMLSIACFGDRFSPVHMG